MPDAAEFASDAWVALLPDAYRDVPSRPGATAVVQQTATGGPDGEVTYWIALDDGRVTRAGAGRHDQPDVTMTSPYTLARQVALGEVDASVPFMQGRTKVAGDQAALLRVLAAMTTDEYRRAAAALADRTS